MEEPRLNPQAPPFYPSRSHRLILPFHANPPPPPPPPPPPATIANDQRRAAIHSLTPVPSGPRIRGGFTHRNRKPVRRDFDRDKKFQEIIPLDPDEHSTTVMIRNIPNNYTRALLVEFLENHCKLENEKEGNTVRSAFDFVYLPVDFKHRLNAGYAFVNFTTSDAAWKFHTYLKGKKWDLFQSKKIADVTRARIQGKDALVRNFERMKLCSPSSDYLPAWFEPPRDGCEDIALMKMHTIGEVQDR